MDAWILFTCAAAAFQTLRFALHKALSLGGLSDAGSTFTRFAYGCPAAALLTLAWLVHTGAPLPALGPGFWPYAMSGAAAQILATICVVALFRARNFAVGIALMKTTVLQTALLALVVLGERISAPGWAAIAIGFAGVLLLTDTPGMTGAWHRRIGPRALALGLGAGALFAVSAVGYRGATLAVASPDPFLRAALTLTLVTAAQTAALGLWLKLAEPGQIAAVWRARRTAVWLGLASMAGSVCWFAAYTLEAAAYVQALGQVELILSLAVSVLVFRERITGREIAGMAVLSLSILLLILAA